MKLFNLIRYIVAICLPIFAFICFGWIWLLICSFIVLFLNNFIDDIVFYYGSAYIWNNYPVKGILSPVEGVVTCVESKVPLFNHLIKKDVLSKDILIGKSIPVKDGMYNHVAIFLNKLNRHLVASLNENAILREFSFNGENVEMVSDGKLIADNEGPYLTNTFIEFEYHQDVHVVITMDKYISKAIVPTNKKAVEMLICRGSQCDVYVPVKNKPVVSMYDTVKVLDMLFESDNYNIYPTNDFYRNEVLDCIGRSG